MKAKTPKLFDELLLECAKNNFREGRISADQATANLLAEHYQAGRKEALAEMNRMLNDDSLSREDIKERISKLNSPAKSTTEKPESKLDNAPQTKPDIKGINVSLTAKGGSEQDKPEENAQSKELFNGTDDKANNQTKGCRKCRNIFTVRGILLECGEKGMLCKSCQKGEKK